MDWELFCAENMLTSSSMQKGIHSLKSRQNWNFSISWLPRDYDNISFEVIVAYKSWRPKYYDRNAIPYRKRVDTNVDWKWQQSTDHITYLYICMYITEINILQSLKSNEYSSTLTRMYPKSLKTDCERSVLILNIPLKKI